MKQVTRILTIDGGGIRGLIPATILERLEQKLCQKSGREHAHLADYFDMIAGTSTGGLLTCIYLAPDDTGAAPRFSAHDAVQLYLTKGADIFHAPLWKQIQSLWGVLDERYPTKPFERIIADYVGDLCLSDLLKPCLITAYDLKNRSTKFFTQHNAGKPDRDYPLSMVARATSAAPTYFEAMPAETAVSDPYAYIDGGVFANNPAMCAYVEAHKRLPGKPTAKTMLLLSLGTGQVKHAYAYRKARNWGMAEWVRPLLDILMTGSSETVDHQLEQLFSAADCPDNYLRIQPTLKDDSQALDDADPENMDYLIEVAVQATEQYDAQLDRMADRLLQAQVEEMAMIE